MIKSVGVIHGRFQPPHIGHLEYLLAGMSRCDFLVIGISNPDPSLTAEDGASQHRARHDSNPYTYYERYLMLESSMIDSGIDRSQFCIVPFPINFPDRLKHYVPMDATFFVTIYDDWGEMKLNVLFEMGLKVEVMWKRKPEDRVASGSQVRELMLNGGEWRQLVSKSVVPLLEQFNNS